MSAAASQMAIRRSASAIRASASATAASAAAIAAARALWQPSHGSPGGHGVGGGQRRPGRCQVAAGLPEVLLRAVQGQGDLFPEVLHLAEVLPDLVLGVGQRLEELAVGAVPGSVPPVLLAARAVADGGAGVEGLQGGGQADDRARVDARALRARRAPR